MPVSPSKFSHEMKIRIKNIDTMDNLKKIYETKKYDSVNSIVNAALEKGLPLLLSGEESLGNPSLIATKVAEQVLQQLSPLANSLLFNMRKITVLQTVQESILGSLIQEFEFYLKTKGVSIDPVLLEEFRMSLPTRFEQDKQVLIERLFNAADTAEEEVDDE